MGSPRHELCAATQYLLKRRWWIGGSSLAELMVPSGVNLFSGVYIYCRMSDDDYRPGGKVF